MVSKKNNDIQCLRAVAILLVLMQHYRSRLPTPESYARLFEHFSFWPGVDIFFAISGFLIYRTFLRDLSTNSTKHAVFIFWARRVTRLFPALVFWGIFSIGVSFFTSSVQGADPAKVAIGAATAFLGISNAYWVNCVQAGFGACGSADFNGVTWSLSLEWQLYALLTTLICIVGRHRALAVMLAVAVFMAFLPGPSFSYVWAFRLQAFTLGALTGLVLEKTTPLMKRPWHQGIPLLLFVCGVLICVSAPTSLPQPFSLPAIAVGAWLCLASTLKGNVFSQYRASKPLVWIGERSYSVYLCHLPLILLTREIMFRTCGLDVSVKNVAIALISLTILLIISAELSYRFIEVRFQSVARQYAPSWFAPLRLV